MNHNDERKPKTESYTIREDEMLLMMGGYERAVWGKRADRKC
jgi:hypothetical protein